MTAHVSSRERWGRKADSDRRRAWVVAVLVLALVAITVGPGAGPARASAPATAGTDATFARLRGDLASAPAADISSSTRKAYAEKARDAQDDAASGKACEALGHAEELRSDAPRRVRRADLSPALAARLDGDLLAVEAALLGSGTTSACGGAQAASSAGPMPLTSVVESDMSHVTMHVDFPLPSFTDRVGDGTSYRFMTMPAGSDDAGRVGGPSIPRFDETVAVPLGAGVSLSVLGTTSYHLRNVLLWPSQPGAPAASFNPAPPFTVDPAAYSSTSAYPAAAAEVVATSSMRDLPVASLSLAGAEYVAATRDLTVLTGVDVRVDFTGANQHTFGDARITGAWENPFRSAMSSLFVNWTAVPPNVQQQVRTICGEEMLVVTPSALRAAADAFAKARTSDGILTRVLQTDGPNSIGTSTTQIRDAIKREYSRRDCEIRPSFVTIFGDYRAVPTFQVKFGPGPDDLQVAGDAPYGFMHQAAQWDMGTYTDVAPDLFVGRITAPDLATADQEVTKILAYEEDPPLDVPGFYDSATAVSYFQQCADPGCRDEKGTIEEPFSQTTEPFVRTSEQLRGLAQFAGKTVDRVTSRDSTNVPAERLDDGSSIPQGMTFDGSAAQISSAVNAGRFLVTYAGHGSAGGWSSPSYKGADVRALTNGAHLPLVWSPGCDTGKLDGDTLSFAEALMQGASNGAAAVLAPTRYSRIAVDRDLTVALAVQLFPEVNNLRPAYARPPMVEIGPLLAVVKAEMFGRWASRYPEGQGHAVMFEDFGDPSMQVWRDQPMFFDHNVSARLVDSHQLRVTLSSIATDGASLTLLNANGEYLGRGVATNGSGDIYTDADLTEANGLSLILSRDRFVSTTVPLPDMGPPNVASVDPHAGSATGGDPVSIVGDGFRSATSVTFGGVPATSMQIHSDTQLVATPPPGSGVVDIVVTNPNGSSATSNADRYSYQPVLDAIRPNSGTTAGGTEVELDGTGFTGATAVHFGATDAPRFEVVDDHHVTATSPPGAGSVDVTITTAGGTSAPRTFEYQTTLTPSVTGVSPAAGPRSGGNHVSISGTGFAGATAVSFGDMPATQFQVMDDNTIDAIAPYDLMAPDRVDVRVTGPSGTSPANPPVDTYTFVYTPNISELSPSSGSVVGGTRVTISGGGFTAASEVTFGSKPAQFTVVDDGRIEAIAPPSDSSGGGPVDVRVTGPGGTSPITPNDTYTYIGFPK